MKKLSALFLIAFSVIIWKFLFGEETSTLTNLTSLDDLLQNQFSISLETFSKTILITKCKEIITIDN